MSKVVFEFINGKLVGLPVGDANGIAGLDSGGKVPTAQLPASVTGALNYRGAWNASTNSPTLASGVGTQGYYYKVSVAGTTSIDGITSWDVGDFIAFNGTTWDKFEGNIGNLTANYIPKATGASSLGNSLITDDGTTVSLLGNFAVNTNQLYVNSSLIGVGIGTATPTGQLEVNRSQNAATSLVVTNANTGTSAETRVRLTNNTAAVAMVTLRGGNQTTYSTLSANVFGMYTDSAAGLTMLVDAVGPITFGTSGAEKVRINGTGSVGIGITAPTAFLHLKAGTASASTAPFKFTLTSAVLNTTAEAGAVEADSSGNLYITDSSAVRGQLLVGRITTQTGITYTVAATDFSIISNYAGTQTLTLPTASSYTGRVLNLRTITANTVISASSNVVPLAGGAAGTAILAATAGKWAMLQSDGTNWQIMSAN